LIDLLVDLNIGKKRRTMDATPESLYLELMKKTLSFLLWEEVGVPIDMYAHLRSLPKRLFVRVLSHLLRAMKLQIVRDIRHEYDQRAEGRVMPMYADTMIGLKRLDNIQYCVENVIRNNIEGDLIETGVWRGGACIFMRAILAAYNISDRNIFVADSFQGLPKPDESRYVQDKGDKHYKFRFTSVSKQKVEANFSKYGLLDNQVVFLEGWFKDTLPGAPFDKLAIMRLDGDMYGSTMDALINLYPKLSEGGFCIVDDYALDSCKQAIDDFRAKWKIKSPLMKIDWTGVYWQKD
jgi:O-methyltransferase